ncbi:MAG: hypothetical protein IJI36_01810 [Kiritimatiellae bacterium]|nr:hypothetical protein [Kiritimatiellia bacterium]
MKNKRMAFDSLAALVMLLTGLLVCLVGCRQEADTKEASKLTADTKDREIQKALNLATNWQSHFDLFYVKSTRFEIKLSHAIAAETDDDRYRKYMGQFIDAAFGIPTDAEDSGARMQQLDSFCRMTDAVLGCAASHRDWDTYWKIALRRLERLQEEWKKLKIRFPDGDPPGPDYPVLGLGGWGNCLKLAKSEYGMAVGDLATLINNILMTHVLSYEKWSDIRSQLETIIGHDVEIRPAILKLWDEKRKKEQAAKSK